METPEHQEYRARQRLSVPAVLKTALAAGLILFVMSGGTPWSTAGSMNAIMGRDLPLNYFWLAIGHFALALVYTWVIGMAIYRFPTWIGVAAGVGVTVLLYGLNYMIYSGIGLKMHSTEGRAFFAHLMFGLFASAIYKAMAVPRPYMDAHEQAHHRPLR